MVLEWGWGIQRDIRWVRYRLLNTCNRLTRLKRLNRGVSGNRIRAIINPHSIRPDFGVLSKEW